MWRFYIFLFLTSVLVPIGAEAQFFNAEQDIRLALQPMVPEPYDEVTVSLDAYTMDTTGAEITWFVDGTEFSESKNLRSISVTAPNVGDSLIVTAGISLRNGQAYEVSETIRPALVDLVIEADTLVPGFYRGRPLPSAGSSIRVIATPNLGTEASGGLTYLWKLNNQVLFGGALRNRNVVDVELGENKNQILSVDVIGQAGEIMARKSLVVPLADPELYFYEINPLRGLIARALESPFVLTNSETIIRAEPYYLDADILNGNVLYEWTLNGQRVVNPNDNQRELNIQKTGDSGMGTVEFHIRNLDQLLQGVREKITVSF